MSALLYPPAPRAPTAPPASGQNRENPPKSTWIRQHVEIQVDSAGTPESTLSDNARYLTTWNSRVPL